jgi:hypothetical protein
MHTVDLGNNPLVCEKLGCIFFGTTGSPLGLRGLPGSTQADDPTNLIRVMPAEELVALPRGA